MNLSTSEASAYPSLSKPRGSTSPTDIVSVQHTSVSHAGSGALNVPSSSSPPLVLDHLLPIESRSSILASAAHCSSLSASYLGATATRNDSEKAALRKGKEKDVLYPSSAIHEDVVVTTDVLSRSPSPQSIVDVTGAVLSPSSPDAEHTPGWHSMV